MSKTNIKYQILMNGKTKEEIESERLELKILKPAEKTLDELIVEEEQRERDEFDDRKNWFNQR